MGIFGYLVVTTALLVVAALGLVACASEESSEPVTPPLPTPDILATITAAIPTPPPTPNIAATIEAERDRLRAEFQSTLVARPTARPLPTSTPSPTMPPTPSPAPTPAATATPIPTPTPGTPAEADRHILESLYSTTGGPEWHNAKNWLSDSPTSEWHGITTDDSGRVTEIRLDSNNLEGTLPEDLSRLHFLAHLSLQNNRLAGPFPPGIGELTSLETLKLGGNSFTGGIPWGLSNLDNLEELLLEGNQLTGPIPTFLGDLSGLRHLRLNGNQLEGPIPPETGKLSNLRSLNVADNRLTGELPADLAGLINVSSFNFAANQGLCSGSNTAFQVWLNGIEKVSGLDCEAGEIVRVDAADDVSRERQVLEALF
ncbi:MAG: hypothetical protein F4X65_11765 [Chloroflexi bacterium]|nr:hypothetical protein [Chloroflexota bacterium]